MTADQDDGTSPGQARRWLTAAAVPGRRCLLLAAGCQVLETVFMVAQWAALAWIAQAALSHRSRPTWPQLVLLLASGLLSAAASWSAARSRAAARQRITRAIRRSLVAGLLPGPTTRRERRGEPDATAAALATMELTEDVADHQTQAVPLRLSAPCTMAVVFAVTAAVQWPAAAILLLASLVVPMNMRLVGLFAKEGVDEQAAASTRLAAVVLDSFRGLRSLAGIGALARRRAVLASAATDLNATTMAIARRALLSGSVMEVVITFSIAANATYIGLSLLGYVRLTAAPPVTLFDGLLTLLLCPMYFQPLRAIAAIHHTQERALSAVPAITALLAETQAPPETAERVTRARPPASGPVTVILDHATFHFPDSDRPILKGADLTVHSGQWTVITGPSGAGKTTLLSLIAGVRQPTAGTVRWLTPGGMSLPHLGACAWIGQQTVILPGSIAENIRIGRPAAGPDQVERAAAAAGLADVVARLPHGLETPLGENGYGLSTGEARRIAIARALLIDAPLWVLDEPTAHLDPDAEARVVQALHRATQGRTVLVATHSLVLARCADTLFTLTDASIHPVRQATPV